MFNFHPAGTSFFIGSDYMISKVTPQFIPVNDFNYHLTIGFNMPIGKRKSDLKHKKSLEVDYTALQSANEIIEEVHAEAEAQAEVQEATEAEAQAEVQEATEVEAQAEMQEATQVEEQVETQVEAQEETQEEVISESETTTTTEESTTDPAL